VSPTNAKYSEKGMPPESSFCQQKSVQPVVIPAYGGSWAVAGAVGSERCWPRPVLGRAAWRSHGRSCPALSSHHRECIPPVPAIAATQAGV